MGLLICGHARPDIVECNLVERERPVGST